MRCIFLITTRVLPRGAMVRDSGAMLTMPVGGGLLGWVLSIFGRSINRQGKN